MEFRIAKTEFLRGLRLPSAEVVMTPAAFGFNAFCADRHLAQDALEIDPSNDHARRSSIGWIGATLDGHTSGPMESVVSRNLPQPQMAA